MAHEKRTTLLLRIIFYISIILVSLFILSPILWMILSSFKQQKYIIRLDNLFVFTPILSNYVKVFARNSFLTPLTNSLIIAVFSAGVGLVMGLPAAYAIARYRMHRISMMIMIIRIIPTLMLLVPLFMLFSNIGIIDTYFAMTITHMLITLPFIIWVMIPFFESVPRELEESALVDGASQLLTFLRILVPMCVPGIVTAGILSFISSWNNFMFALVLAGKHTKTLPIAIFSFMSYSEIDWGGLMAAAVVIALPIMVISMVLQKYVISGMTAGAVKG